MDLNGSQKFNAPPQKVWDTLMNPVVLKECIPGAQEVTINGNQLNFTVHVSAPFLSGDFALGATIVSQTPPTNAVLSVDRTGSYGGMKGQVTLELAPDGAGTNLTYNAHLDLSGKIGMADNMIGQQVIKAGLGQFFKNLESKV